MKKDEKTRLRIYKEFINKILRGDDALITQPLLSMLYEMDYKLFLKEFIRPLLVNIREYCLHRGNVYNYQEIQVQKLLSVINEMFYGNDADESIRNLFCMRKHKDNVHEIEQLMFYMENDLEINENEDFFLSDFFNDI